MPAYQSSAGGGIGSLLRQIQEDKTTNPAAVLPGDQPSAALRGTVQTPVLKPESPGTTRTVSLPGEGAGLPGGGPQLGTTTPGQSIIGFAGQRGGPGPSFDGSNIPGQKGGPLPTSTPTSQIAAIPIAPSITPGAPPAPAAPLSPPPGTGLPPPGSRSFIQTPAAPTNGKAVSGSIPYSPEANKTAAESVVEVANNELKSISDIASTKGFDSQEGQQSLDRLQKLSEQLAPLAQNAPDYLKQNLLTLQQNVGALRLQAVQEQAKSFRQIPAWATPEERAAGQAVIDQINMAIATAAGQNNNSGGESSAPNNAPSAPVAPSGQVMGASAARSSAPNLGSNVYPSGFIGPFPPSTQQSKIAKTESNIKSIDKKIATSQAKTPEVVSLAQQYVNKAAANKKK